MAERRKDVTAVPPLFLPVTLPQPYRTSDLLRLSQRAASRHLDELGLGDTAGEQGLAWFITRIRMELFRTPDAQLIAETWPGTTRKGMMPRYCILRGEDGLETARFQTVWALTDVKTRQMRLDEAITVPDMTRGDEPPLPRSLPRKDMPLLGKFVPQPHQIDKNGHMTNTAYPDAAEDTAAQLIRGRTVTTLSIDYRAEILPHTEIAVYGGETEDGIWLCGKSEEKEHFRMMLTVKD